MAEQNLVTEKIPKRQALFALASVMIYPLIVGMWIGHSMDLVTLQIVTGVLILAPVAAAYLLPPLKKAIRKIRGRSNE